METLKWKKSASGSLVSAGAGDYRIHSSGHHQITTYKLKPFERFGTFPSVKEATTFCQNHYDENQ